jgi:hypothetical protein
MVKGNDKGPDAHETEARSAVVLKAKIVIPGRPEGSRGEARAPMSVRSRTARVGARSPCFTCFIWSRSGIGKPFNRNCTRSRVPMPGDYNANMAIA